MSHTQSTLEVEPKIAMSGMTIDEMNLALNILARLNIGDNITAWLDIDEARQKAKLSPYLKWLLEGLEPWASFIGGARVEDIKSQVSLKGGNKLAEECRETAIASGNSVSLATRRRKWLWVSTTLTIRWINEIESSKVDDGRLALIKENHNVATGWLNTLPSR